MTPLNSCKIRIFRYTRFRFFIYDGTFFFSFSSTAFLAQINLICKRIIISMSKSHFRWKFRLILFALVAFNVTSPTRAWFSVFLLSLILLLLMPLPLLLQLSHPYLSIYFMASFVFSSSHSPDYSLLFIAHRLIRIFVYLSKVFYIYFPFSSIECKLFTWLIRWFMISWLAFFSGTFRIHLYNMQYLEHRARAIMRATSEYTTQQNLINI